MYLIWLVEWAGELLEGECLVGGQVNVDAPACQTGASWSRGLALEMAVVTKTLGIWARCLLVESE